MLRRRVRSALYIDFENVPLQPDAVANWLAWLEDGRFEPSGRRRRFLIKRVYWNSHAERHRATFERNGISAILVGKFSGLKNGADIRMAMDVVEATYTRSEIDEYILLTGDSDFVPVLQRLREKAKRTAIVATEHRPNIHTTYGLHADLLIPSRRLTEAAQYRRVAPGLLRRLLAPGSVTTTARAAGIAPPAKPIMPSQPLPPPARPHSPSTASTPRPVPVAIDIEPSLQAALARIVKLMAQQPHNFVAQRRVMAELDRVAGFRRQGPGALFGYTTYRALMRELARREPRIKVIEQHGGGTGVVFVTDPAASPQRSSATLTVVASSELPASVKPIGAPDPDRSAPNEPQPGATPPKPEASAKAESGPELTTETDKRPRPLVAAPEQAAG
ncbi:MAG: NYN domain-containing protein [Hyphomicrobiaceae bacterium]|nr:NYN domain-containing protein [Hyphomicrobiaceae bacterium]